MATEDIATVKQSALTQIFMIHSTHTIIGCIMELITITMTNLDCQ